MPTQTNQNMFSDQEKEALAASVGISGANPDLFNKEYVDGEWKMYIKGGAGEKIFGAKPVSKPGTVSDQVNAFKSQVSGKTMDDIYASMLVRPPSSTDIRQKIGHEGGYLDKIEGVRGQAMDIRRSMLGDQSAIFADPNLTPEQKKAQYEVSMKSYMDRIAQLNEMENAYNSELETRVKVETDRAQQENDRNKVVLDWFKAKTDQENKDKQFQLEREKMAQGQYQFNETNRLGWANLQKPDKSVDPWTGETTYTSPYSVQSGQSSGAPASGAEMMKALASGTYGGKKFFGVYATGDMTGDQRAAIYKTAEKEGLDAFVSKYKGPVTSAMISSSAQKYGIDPLALATILAADSGMGSKGIGSRNNNPGNVGQFDSMGTTPTKGYATMQEGVDAAAANLKKRQDALLKQTGAATDGVPMSKTPFDSKGVGEALKELGMKGEITADKSKVAYSMAKEKNWTPDQVREFVAKQKEEGGTETEKFRSEVKTLVDSFSSKGDYKVEDVAKQILKKYPEKDYDSIVEMVYNVDPDKKSADDFDMEVETLSSEGAFDGNEVTFTDEKGKEQKMVLGDYVKKQLLPYGYDKATVAGILIKSGIIADETGGNVEGDSWFEWMDEGYDSLVDAFGGKDALKKAIEEYNRQEVPA